MILAFNAIPLGRCHSLTTSDVTAVRGARAANDSGSTPPSTSPTYKLELANDDFDHQLISLFIWPDMTHFDPSKSLDENPYEYELSEHKLASTKVA